MRRYLKFWGTRGSCPVSGREYACFGGNTCCLEVCYEDVRVIIDAGTGIRPLGNALPGDLRQFHLFFGHAHWDHLIGLPFFDPLFREDVQVVFWAPQGEGRTFRQLVEDVFSPEFFPTPMKAAISYETIREQAPIRIGPLTLTAHKTHHPSATFCFKIQTPHQTIGYVTDNEALPGYHGAIADAPRQLFAPHESLIRFLHRADLLIHEGQYMSAEYRGRAGWGHSSIRNAAALVQKIEPGKWFVSHHDPRHADEDIRRLAREGESLREQGEFSCPIAWLADGEVIELL